MAKPHKPSHAQWEVLHYLANVTPRGREGYSELRDMFYAATLRVCQEQGWVRFIPLHEVLPGWLDPSDERNCRPASVVITDAGRAFAPPTR